MELFHRVRLQLKNAQILDIGPFRVDEKRRNDGLVGVEIEVDNMSLFVTYAIIGTIHGETFDHRGRTEFVYQYLQFILRDGVDLSFILFADCLLKKLNYTIQYL